jgi:hypothetical protein
MVPRFGICDFYEKSAAKGIPFTTHVESATGYSDKQLVEDLIAKGFPAIKSIFTLPKAYCTNPAGIKAIYLGCDPSNGNEPRQFEYAFALEALSGKDIGLFKRFVDFHATNLDQVGLGWEDVYVQNLCRNYFDRETSKNLFAWKKAATEYWIAIFNKEIEWIPAQVPVLLTSAYLYKVLVKGIWAKLLAPDFYQLGHEIPVPAENNWLNRPLIPFYRGQNPNLKVDYHLSHAEWQVYRETVYKLVHQG